MRSLTRVSVLMGPPLLGFHVFSGNDQRLGRSGFSRWEHHTISRKALHQQGPMPTDHGPKSIKPPALTAEQACITPVTGPFRPG